MSSIFHPPISTSPIQLSSAIASSNAIPAPPTTTPTTTTTTTTTTTATAASSSASSSPSRLERLAYTAKKASFLAPSARTYVKPIQLRPLSTTQINQKNNYNNHSIITTGSNDNKNRSSPGFDNKLAKLNINAINRNSKLTLSTSSNSTAVLTSTSTLESTSASASSLTATSPSNPNGLIPLPQGIYPVLAASYLSSSRYHHVARFSSSHLPQFDGNHIKLYPPVLTTPANPTAETSIRYPNTPAGRRQAREAKKKAKAEKINPPNNNNPDVNTATANTTVTNHSIASTHSNPVSLNGNTINISSSFSSSSLSSPSLSSRYWRLVDTKTGRSFLGSEDSSLPTINSINKPTVHDITNNSVNVDSNQSQYVYALLSIKVPNSIMSSTSTSSYHPPFHCHVSPVDFLYLSESRSYSVLSLEEAESLERTKQKRFDRKLASLPSLQSFEREREKELIVNSQNEEGRRNGLKNSGGREEGDVDAEGDVDEEIDVKSSTGQRGKKKGASNKSSFPNKEERKVQVSDDDIELDIDDVERNGNKNTKVSKGKGETHKAGHSEGDDIDDDNDDDVDDNENNELNSFGDGDFDVDDSRNAGVDSAGGNVGDTNDVDFEDEFEDDEDDNMNFIGDEEDRTQSGAENEEKEDNEISGARDGEDDKSSIKKKKKNRKRKEQKQRTKKLNEFKTSNNQLNNNRITNNDSESENTSSDNDSDHNSNTRDSDSSTSSSGASSDDNDIDEVKDEDFLLSDEEEESQQSDQRTLQQLDITNQNLDQLKKKKRERERDKSDNHTSIRTETNSAPVSTAFLGDHSIHPTVLPDSAHTLTLTNRQNEEPTKKKQKLRSQEKLAIVSQSTNISTNNSKVASTPSIGTNGNSSSLVPVTAAALEYEFSLSPELSPHELNKRLTSRGYELDKTSYIQLLKQYCTLNPQTKLLQLKQQLTTK